ncbi:MAG TPA: hypothetical protein RMF84_13540 [Polyangiaceae bacterium LLY-WYZ-14_1]|nr:hypothetical protein [Polyangiaceae bacterium LLY-WYZ-14_1]
MPTAAQLPQKGPGYVPSARIGGGKRTRTRKTTALTPDVAIVGTEPAFRSVAWDGVPKPLPEPPRGNDGTAANRSFHATGTRRSQKRRRLEIEPTMLVRGAFGGVRWGGDVVEERPTDRQVAFQTQNVLNSFGWE